MKKTIFLILLTSLLMSIVVYGDEIVSIFNFNTLGDIAVENSLSLNASQLVLDNKILDKEELEKELVTAYAISGNPEKHVEYRTKFESDPILAEMEVYLAGLAIEKETEDLKDTLYKKGMEYQLLLDEIALNEKLLENEGVYQENIEKKVSNGIATSTDLTNQAITYQNQELKVIELKASLDALTIEINHLLGHDLDAEIIIEDTIKKMLFTQFDIDTLYDNRYSNYPDVYRKTVDLESKTIIFNLYNSKYNDTTKEYKTALYNMQLADIALSDAKKNFEVSLRSAYNTYLNNNDTYELAVKQLELQEKLYSDTKLRYDLGLVNDEDLLIAETSKLNAEYALTLAIYNFNLSRIDLDALY